MKVWMWQRLWKKIGQRQVRVMLRYREDDLILPEPEGGRWHWLCPKPQLVLVDRKHFGGME